MISCHHDVSTVIGYITAHLWLLFLSVLGRTFRVPVRIYIRIRHRTIDEEYNEMHMLCNALILVQYMSKIKYKYLQLNLTLESRQKMVLIRNVIIS